MAATRAGLAAACSSPSFRRDWRSSPPNSRSNGISFPTRRSALHSEQAQTTPTTTTTTSSVSQNRRLEKMNGAETIPRPLVDPDFSEVERASLKDYFEQSKDLIRSDGGPPRWFSPLESGSQLKNSPLLLFLPGVDGVGLGLIRHHQRLGKIFDIWCLHIPVMDRTPFTDLVELVERTIRSENYRSPNRPIYLVGESLGGCLALAVASRNSTMDLVLILANPATSFTKSPLQPLIPLLEVMPDQLYQNFPYTLSLIGGDPFRIAMASMEKRLSIQQTIGELSEGLVALSSHLSVLADILPRETLLWKLQMLKSASAIANSRIHAVRAQTLILSSERDQFLPSQGEGERLCCALPNCELRKFDGIGHFLFLEDGFDLATIIKSVSFYRRGKYHDYVSDYMPPTPSEFKQAAELSRWVGGATSPVMLSTLEDGRVVRGLAGIPTEGPVLLVGNHMLLGSEVTWLVPMFLAERNIIVRGMAHPLLFLKDGGLSDITPYDIVRLMGGVPVSGNNLYKLLSSKSHVLLYPGGVREALHRKGEEYKLFWPEQSEFVRMAAKFEAKIIPFGAVGEDDIGEVVFDYNDQMKIPYLRAVIEEQTTNSVKLRTDSNGEVANQGMHLPGILPKLPGRFYFRFGKPIETEGWKHELRDREKCQELYLQVKSEVESCMDYLRERRERDPYRNILARVLYQATQGSTSEIPTFEF